LHHIKKVVTLPRARKTRIGRLAIVTSRNLENLCKGDDGQKRPRLWYIIPYWEII